MTDWNSSNRNYAFAGLDVDRPHSECPGGGGADAYCCELAHASGHRPSVAKGGDAGQTARSAGLFRRCLKWGRWEGEDRTVEGNRRVEPLDSAEALAENSYIILGATGFGLYQDFEGRKGTFSLVFDWVVFDEASQMLIPQALLSLTYGKGIFSFTAMRNSCRPSFWGTTVRMHARRSTRIGRSFIIFGIVMARHTMSGWIRSIG